MEVGWYLRLSKAREVEALVREDIVASLEDQAAMNTAWAMEVQGREGYMRVLFTRKESP
ncbi:hypothetical protein [Desulfocurvus sp. DL9XJH121]